MSIKRELRAYLIRNALTRQTNEKTRVKEKSKLQSLGQPSKPHFGSSRGGTPLSQRMLFEALNWSFGNPSLDVDTKDPTCCIVMAVSLTYCIEKTEKFPSAFPFSSIKT